MKTYIVTRKYYGTQAILVKNAKSKADAIRQVETIPVSAYDQDASVVGLSAEVDGYAAASSWVAIVDGEKSA